MDRRLFFRRGGQQAGVPSGDSLSVMKKAYLERHYTTKHRKLADLTGQCRVDKVATLKKELCAQQTVLTKLSKDTDSVVQVSYAVSELIVNKLKPHCDGEFIKECMVLADGGAGLLCSEKNKLFENVNLSRGTVSDRIQEMAGDIEQTLKQYAARFEAFYLALDESTDLTNTAQLAIFVRGVTADFVIIEELAALKPMHGTTTGRDLLTEVKAAIEQFDLPLHKLSGITTDGAPCMRGCRNGLTNLLKNEMATIGIDPTRLIVNHCIVHQENCVLSQLE